MRYIAVIALLTTVTASTLAQQQQMPRGDAARGKALYEANKCADATVSERPARAWVRISPESATPGRPNSCTARSSRQTTR